jgi:hypothetical protein
MKKNNSNQAYYDALNTPSPSDQLSTPSASDQMIKFMQDCKVLLAKMREVRENPGYTLPIEGSSKTVVLCHVCQEWNCTDPHLDYVSDCSSSSTFNYEEVPIHIQQCISYHTETINQVWASEAERHLIAAQTARQGDWLAYRQKCRELGIGYLNTLHDRFWSIEEIAMWNTPGETPEAELPTQLHECYCGMHQYCEPGTMC